MGARRQAKSASISYPSSVGLIVAPGNDTLSLCDLQQASRSGGIDTSNAQRFFDWVHTQLIDQQVEVLGSTPRAKKMRCALIPAKRTCWPFHGPWCSRDRGPFPCF
jgi:hypothetical protein